MVIAANLGFPRVGARRELKTALEAHWKGEISAEALAAEGARLRAIHWRLQRAAGIDSIPSNDFSFYDQMLDTTALLGALPERFGPLGERVTPEEYFAMARGTKTAPAMEMTKWFDTNYHYIVPEFTAGQSFRLASLKPVEEFLEAKALGILTRPVLIGPVTWLSLGKARGEGVEPLGFLPQILPIYAEILARLAAAGAEWVQMDEPILALDLSAAQRSMAAFRKPPKSAALAPIIARGFSRTALMRLSSKPKRNPASGAKRPSGWICSRMANSSATTWSSILASSSPASPSRAWLGCKATARAASSRR